MLLFHLGKLLYKANYIKELKQAKFRINNQKNETLELKDIIPNPILIRNKYNTEVISERVLHELIMEDIEFIIDYNHI